MSSRNARFKTARVGGTWKLLPQQARTSSGVAARVPSGFSPPLERVRTAASMKPSFRASSTRAVMVPPCWAFARMDSSAARVRYSPRKGPISGRMVSSWKNWRRRASRSVGIRGQNRWQRPSRRSQSK